jgi:hypothetical protein
LVSRVYPSVHRFNLLLHIANIKGKWQFSFLAEFADKSLERVHFRNKNNYAIIPQIQVIGRLSVGCGERYIHFLLFYPTNVPTRQKAFRIGLEFNDIKSEYQRNQIGIERPIG